VLAVNTFCVLGGGVGRAGTLTRGARTAVGGGELVVEVAAVVVTAGGLVEG